MHQRRAVKTCESILLQTDTRGPRGKWDKMINCESQAGRFVRFPPAQSLSCGSVALHAIKPPISIQSIRAMLFFGVSE